MKYLKPEMDIVEFDESVLTGDITVSGSDDNLGGTGSGGDLPTTDVLQ